MDFGVSRLFPVLLFVVSDCLCDEHMCWYYTPMSFRRKTVVPGSIQVASSRFTYQDRVHSFSGTGVDEGLSALSTYGALFGTLERKLLVRFSAGDCLSSLKKGYLSEYRIPARMFNSLRVSVEGKVSAARESQQRLVESLERRIGRAEEQTVEFGKRGDRNGVHQKKRRLSALCERLESLKADVAVGRVRICLGSRRLWRKQYVLGANGYSCHAEWKRDWREARSDEFFVLGSKDETAGCQLSVASVRDDGKLDLRLRLPDALRERHGKYLVMEGIHFNHGHAQVLAALQVEPRALSYRFKRDRKGWRVFVSLRHQAVPVVTERRLGAIGVDVNVDHLAVSETDFSGNWLRSWSVPLVTRGKSRRRAEALIGDAVALVVARAREAGKPLVIEKLDFSKKKDLLEGESPGRSRMLSSFAYGRVTTFFVCRGYREGVEVREVNPAFSSVIGRVNFMERYGLSVHQAAALVLARRSLGCSERISRRRVAPAGNGVQVAFTVPARKRVKHVWTYWGAISKQLRPALAEQRRLRGSACKRACTPVGAGLLIGVGPGCEPFGVPGRDSRAEPPCAVGAAA